MSKKDDGKVEDGEEARAASSSVFRLCVGVDQTTWPRLVKAAVLYYLRTECCTKIRELTRQHRSPNTGDEQGCGCARISARRREGLSWGQLQEGRPPAGGGLSAGLEDGAGWLTKRLPPPTDGRILRSSISGSSRHFEWACGVTARDSLAVRPLLLRRGWSAAALLLPASASSPHAACLSRDAACLSRDAACYPTLGQYIILMILRLVAPLVTYSLPDAVGCRRRRRPPHPVVSVHKPDFSYAASAVARCPTNHYNL